MEDLYTEDLINAIHDYIRENYSYEQADLMGDEIVYHLENGKEVYISVSLDKDADEDE